MQSSDLSEHEHAGSFRPRLRGCVTVDRRRANILLSCYMDTFSCIAANIDRSLIAAEQDMALGDLFEAVAEADLSELRLLGELIRALGGEVTLSGMRLKHAKAGRVLEVGDLLAQAILERGARMERYEHLLMSTNDRVLRSVLERLLSSNRQTVALLSEKQGG